MRQGNQGATLAQYGYDGLNRLTQVMDGPTGTPIETYAFDATGNRTSLTNAGITTAYNYPASSHRLDKVGSIARTYDAAGNTTKIGGNARQFGYDDSGRMTQVKAGGTVMRQYQYNAKGEQTRSYRDADNAYFVYDEAGHLLGEYDTSGTPKQQTLWFGDLPVGVLQGSGASQRLHYIEPDHLGTPRAIIDGTRNVAIWEWKLIGEVFGATPPNKDPDQDGINFTFDLRFPGQRYDSATGLNYNYFRDYEPSTGRYISSDPVGLAAGVSTYSYVVANPLVAIDRLGLDSAIFYTDRYRMPPPLMHTKCRLNPKTRKCMAKTFNVSEQDIDNVEIKGDSIYANMFPLFWGGDGATTLRNEINYTGPCSGFSGSHFMLHEYFHVFAQWGQGMTIASYLLNSGKWEAVADKFADENKSKFDQCMKDGCP